MRRKHVIKAALEIWDNLSDRSGFGFECLKYDDRETYCEIIGKMADIIQEKTEAMANIEYVPPTIYGPTPVDPNELEREASKLVAEIQKTVDAQTEPAPEVDPWELLRELLRVSRVSTNLGLAICAKCKNALKHHDEGAKNGKP